MQKIIQLEEKVTPPLQLLIGCLLVYGCLGHTFV